MGGVILRCFMKRGNEQGLAWGFCFWVFLGSHVRLGLRVSHHRASYP